MDPISTTRLLNLFGRGERGVEGDLLEAIYSELHVLAAHSLKRQAPEHTLQPTALIHEAWIRLVRQEELEFEGRGQFYALATKIMRSVLVDHARRAQRDKRVGPGQRIALEVDEEDFSVTPTLDPLDLLALEDVLIKLEDLDATLARVVEMRFYGGLSHAEIATTLGVSERTVERNWRTARAFLSSELSE